MESFIGLPVLFGFFVVAVVMGAVISRTNFCTMGAVSDWVNLHDFGRLGAWLLATVVAALIVVVMEITSVVDISGARPPYRSSTFAWLRYLLGGLMFGVGMTLAGGCVSRNLVRFGGGNLKSLVTLLIAGVFAYFMTKTAFYEVGFYSWIHPISVDLAPLGIQSQDVGSIISAILPSVSGLGVRVTVVVLLAMSVVWFVLKTRGIQGNMANISAGLVIGGAVGFGWYLTAGPIGMEWWEAAEWADSPPVGVGAQSYTFVNPLGEFISLALDVSNFTVLLTVGMMAAVGLVVGAVVDSLLSRSFKVVWFTSFGDFVANSVGGVLMGIGGVLALGCTVGQGVSGLSTLALGSALALGSIIFGSAATLKTQYYKLVYEDANVFDALISGLVDLRVLPSSMRRLEAI